MVNKGVGVLKGGGGTIVLKVFSIHHADGDEDEEFVLVVEVGNAGKDILG